MRVPELTSSHGARPLSRAGVYRSVAHFRLTNKTPAATYRAPGRFEGTFVRERLMDAIAAKLGIDRIEIRRRNLIGAEEMPFARGLSALGTDLVYDSGDYTELLDKIARALRMGSGQCRLQTPPPRNGRSGRSRRLACFVEKTGLGPKDTRARQR